MSTNRQYNAYAVRRCVRVADTAAGGIVVFKTKSFTAADPEDAYHPMVDVQTGAVMCDCPHFTYRLAKHHPTAAAGAVCKHLARAMDNLKRRGLL